MVSGDSRAAIEPLLVTVGDSPFDPIEAVRPPLVAIGANCLAGVKASRAVGANCTTLDLMLFGPDGALGAFGTSGAALDRGSRAFGANFTALDPALDPFGPCRALGPLGPRRALD